MGILERRKREKAQKQADILAVAKELIIEGGLETFSLQQVANRLEISKAALYLSFQNKDALILAALKDASEQFQCFLIERLALAKTGLDGLKIMARGYFEFFCTRHQSFLLIGVWEHFAPAAPFHVPVESVDIIRQFKKIIMDVLRKGVEDGTLLASIQPENVSETVLFLANSMVSKVSRIPKEIRNLDQIIPHMTTAFELILRALASEHTDKTELTLGIDASCLLEPQEAS